MCTFAEVCTGPAAGTSGQEKAEQASDHSWKVEQATVVPSPQLWGLGHSTQITNH